MALFQVEVEAEVEHTFLQKNKHFTSPQNNLDFVCCQLLLSLARGNTIQLYIFSMEKPFHAPPVLLVL